jgi:DNA polymerase-1
MKLSKKLKIPMKEAKDLISGYWEVFGTAKKFFDDIVQEAIKTMSLRSLYDGRVYWIENKDPDNPADQASIRNAAMNYPMQSGNASITKIAMTRIRNKFRGTDAKIILQIHDELVSELPAEGADVLFAVQKQEMIAAGEELVKNVPIKVEGELDIKWSK